MTETNPRTPTPVSDPPERVEPESDRLAERASTLRVASTIPVPAGHDEVTRDVRARRPSLLTALRRGRAPQRLARVASLLALDFGAIWSAIFSALAFKEAVRGTYSFDRVSGQTWDYLPFVFLVTALLFARSGLYSRREARPGLVAIIAGAVPGHDRVARCSRSSNGLDFRSYYIFYGGFVLRSRSAWRALAGSTSAASALALTALGRQPARDPGRLRASRSRPSRTRCRAATARATRPSATSRSRRKPDNGLRNLGAPRGPAAAARRAPDAARSIIADPDFPQNQAFELVDRCHERGVAVRIAPTTMEIMTHRHELVPGSRVPLFELKPPVFEGIDFVVKRTLRRRRRGAAAGPAVAAAADDRAGVKADLPRARCSSAAAGPGIGGAAVRLPQVPHHARRTPSSARTSSRSYNEASGRALQDPQRPAPDADRRLPAPLQPRRAAAARERAARRDVDGRARGRCRSATTTGSRTGTASATWCCPASPGCGRSRAGRSSTSTSSCASTSSTWSAGACSSTSRSC